KEKENGSGKIEKEVKGKVWVISYLPLLNYDYGDEVKVDNMRRRMRKIGIAKVEATCQNDERKQKIHYQASFPLEVKNNR
ncbi:unnamed protein product, partial [marine sediment metagenome]